MRLPCNRIFIFVFMFSLFSFKGWMTEQPPYPVMAENSFAEEYNNDINMDIQILRDKNIEWKKRSMAAMQLGETKDKRAVEPLIQALADDKHWAVRKNAAVSLGSIGNKRAVDSLIHALHSDTNALVRSDAALSLGIIADPGAVRHLIHSLESDSNVFVRSEAARSLGKLKDRSAIEHLKKALKDPGILTRIIKGEEVEIKEVAKAAEEALKQMDVIKKSTPIKKPEFETVPVKDNRSVAPGMPEKAEVTPDIKKPLKKWWVIQVALYSSKDRAKKAAEGLWQDGYSAYVAESTLEGNPVYRLRVGFFSSKQEAEKQKKKFSVKREMKGAWVVRPPKSEIKTHLLGLAQE